MDQPNNTPRSETVTDGGDQDNTTTEDVLATVQECVDEKPVTTASEVAEQLPVSRRTVLNRLRVLERGGEVESHQFGSRTVVWWPTSREPVESVDERGRLTSTATQEPRMDEDPASGSGDEPVEPQGKSGESTEDDLADSVRSYIEAEDLPPKTNHGRDAVMAVFRTLRDEGEAMKTSELQAAVYPSFEDHWSAGRSMWQSLNRYLEDIPGIEKADYGTWTYEGDDVVRRELDEA